LHSVPQIDILDTSRRRCAGLMPQIAGRTLQGLTLLEG
jgi:hypothetical protein